MAPRPHMSTQDADGAHVRVDNSHIRYGSGHTASENGASPTIDSRSDVSATEYAQSGFLRYNRIPPSSGVVDVIAVSAVGADAEQTWKGMHYDPNTGVETEVSWIDALGRTNDYARVLIYKHGEPDKTDDLDTLALRLLDHIMSDRDVDSNRPLFFVCHSTGGLVVKAALIQAQSESGLREQPKYTSIKRHCYGITFFATPHQGSSFLSSPAFDDSIKAAMKLIYMVPRPLQRQLEVNSKKLIEMSREFNRVAAELTLFSFYETKDTVLTPSAHGKGVVSFKAPIVSIKSAVLELHHEVERPLEANHAKCAAFDEKNNYAQWSYLEKLKKAAEKSLKLCTKPHIELDLKQKAEVEVHGFYVAENNPSSGKAPIRLWTTKVPLKEFIAKGPAKCLHELLEDIMQDLETEQIPTDIPGTPTPTREMESDSGVMNGNAAIVESWGSESPQTPQRLHLSPSTPKLRTIRQSSSERYDEMALTRPNVDNQIVTWIHLPFNNPTWCAEILRRIAEEKQNDCHVKFLRPKNWQKNHIWGRHTEYHACFMKPGCNLINPEIEVLADLPESYPSKPLKAEIQMSFYFPYLHWDTYKRMVRRRDIIKERIAQGRSRPTPPRVAKLDLEHMVSWRYMSYDPPFNTRRTLDQFGYPHLLDTRARDDDQMLYKMTKVRKESEFGNNQRIKRENIFNRQEDVGANIGEEVAREEFYKSLKDGKVLMVDQVWLWIVDNTTAVTFFPKREPIDIEGRLYQQADLRNSIYNEVNGDLGSRCDNSLDLSALVTLHAVTLLFERASHRDLEIFRIFEESISILVEKMTFSFKYFRAKGFRATADEEHTREDASSMKKRHKKEGREFQEQIRDNVTALLELRDISDELSTLKKLFEQQQESVDQMLDYYERCGHGKTNGCSFLHKAQLKLKDYLHQIQQMMESADRTKNDFEKLLDLIQRQANVDEARLSRWQADVQGVQSRAVMIFTVFNIIFLPLTFFTGLFGMNVREWGDMNSNFTPASRVAEISIPISVVIIVGALSFALSTRVRSICGFALRFTLNPFEPQEPSLDDPRNSTQEAENGGAPSLQGAEINPRGVRAKYARRRIKKYKSARKGAEPGLSDTDFWQEQRDGDETERGYRIPVHNRWPDRDGQGTGKGNEGANRVGGRVKSWSGVNREGKMD